MIDGDSAEAVRLTEEVLAAGVDADELMRGALMPAMNTVGDQFSKGEIYVPEMLVAAKAMKSALGLLRPLLVRSGAPSRGTVVIGTVQGDLHDIGKNIVGMTLEGAGFEVRDLGVDVPAGRFVEAVREHRPQLLGLSCLITTTMPMMQTVIEALEAEGVRGEVKVLVGGAPVTGEYAETIRADGYAPDAGAASLKAVELATVA